MSEKQVSPINPDYPQPEAAVFDGWRIDKDRLDGAALIANYGDFVLSVCYRYHHALMNKAGGTVAWHDLRQAGNIEILRETDYFNPRQDERFLTYAGLGIKGAIYEEYFRHHGAVELPETFMKSLRLYDQEANQRQRTWEPPITDHELATLLDIPETGRAVRKSRSEPISVPNFRTIIAVKSALPIHTLTELDPEALDTAVSLTSGVSLPHPEEHGMKTVLRAQLGPALKGLIDEAFATDSSMPASSATARQRQKEILVAVCGLEDGRPKKIKDLAESRGVTISAISAVYNKALRHLREVVEDPKFQWLQDFL